MPAPYPTTIPDLPPLPRCGLPLKSDGRDIWCGDAYDDSGCGFSCAVSDAPFQIDGDEGVRQL